MDCKNQVLDQPGEEVVTCLAAVEGAIRDAWGRTVQQVQFEGYSPKILLTLFPQMLVHNVMHLVGRISRSVPGLTAELRPNRNRSAYHVVARLPGMFITISALRDPDSIPRFALFRANYAAGQYAFDIDWDNRFAVVPLDEPGSSEGTTPYFQIMHGPLETNRHAIGFVNIVRVNGRGEFVSLPQALSDYIGRDIPCDAVEQPSETITESFGLKLIPSEPTMEGESYVQEQHPGIRWESPSRSEGSPSDEGP